MKRGGVRPGIELEEKKGGFGKSWSRMAVVTIGRKISRKFRVGVSQGNSVRIAFRGNQRGFEWWGYVSTERGGRLYNEKVQGSTGAAGLLAAAGVYFGPCATCGSTEDIRFTYDYRDNGGTRKYLCGTCHLASMEHRKKWLEGRIVEERATNRIWLADRYVPCPKCGKFLVELPSEYARRGGAKTPSCELCVVEADQEFARAEIHRKLWIATRGDRDRWSVTKLPLARLAIEDKITHKKIVARAFEVAETLTYFMPSPLPEGEERVGFVWNQLREVALEEA